MSACVRPALLTDLQKLTELLLADAQAKQALNPALWPVAGDAEAKIAEAVTFALTAEKQPFRQKWLVAVAGEKLVGVIHSAKVPVPPIYAGPLGDPGPLMPDYVVLSHAPAGTIEALVDAAEADLREAGARLLLSSFVSGDDWRACLSTRSYRPVTLYLAKAGLAATATPPAIRKAAEADVPRIVDLSATNREILERLDPFWIRHPEADQRFGGWMSHSLSLRDRDMLVAGASPLNGYIIAQPSSRLHFPAAHDISATGTIDDFYAEDFADPAELKGEGAFAGALLQAAETAFAGRGVATALVVCPAAWTSKRRLLEAAGYTTGLTWMIKR